MTTPPAGISEADWLATPAAVQGLILAQQEEIEQLRTQLTALATELASLRERIGRSSRNSSNPPSSDGPGFKPPERGKGSGRKRGGQPGHPGSGPELLRWWSTTRRPAAAAARCCRERIKNHCAIR
jgi:transposase